MAEYLVVGAGSIGKLTAEFLAEQGHTIRITSRSGSGPTHPLIERVAMDASQVQALTAAAAGASAIFNCANPAYHRWPTDWPPIANALLTAAEKSGAVLVTLSNLYAYGRPNGPMTPQTPFNADYEKARVRGRMWLDALAAHEQGRIRATEVRASDFIGTQTNVHIGDRVVPRILAGKSCQVMGDPSMPHSWTYTEDVARTLIACAQNAQAWGRAWHAPTNEPRSQKQVIDEIADLAGVPRVGVTSVPEFILPIMGLFNPALGEMSKVMYQFKAPFVIDDSETRELLGLQPTPWPKVLAATLGRYRKDSTTQH
jgi:nucleoside-diphosphate-sugar epimerase